MAAAQKPPEQQVSTEFKNIPRSAKKVKEGGGGAPCCYTYKPHLVVAVKRDICGQRPQPAAGDWPEQEANAAICWQKVNSGKLHTTSGRDTHTHTCKKAG